MIGKGDDDDDWCCVEEGKYGVVVFLGVAGGNGVLVLWHFEGGQGVNKGVI